MVAKGRTNKDRRILRKDVRRERIRLKFLKECWASGGAHWIGMRTADSDIEEESIIALLMVTEKGPDGKVTYGGARRGRENSLGLRGGKEGRREGQ
jgi:hypothetical protein